MSWFDRNLWEEFRARAHHERTQRAAWDRRRDKEKDQDREDREGAAADDVMAALDQAAELREMAHRLDALDLQVTQSLMQNNAQLDAVRARLSLLLSGAVQLPDGRRVFRTEDGTQVFDEHGEEVAPDVIDPNSIGEDLPSWEEFQAEQAREAELMEERQRLLELQNEIDKARDGIETETLETSELDALEAEFTQIQDGPNEPTAELAGEGALDTVTDTVPTGAPPRLQ